GIAYTGLATLTITLGPGGNTFTIATTPTATTTISTGAGNDTVSVQATGGPTTIHADQGTDTITVGTLAPTAGGVLDSIQATLTVTGGGGALLGVDDTGASVPTTGRLTASALTGLGMGPGGIA